VIYLHLDFFSYRRRW